MVSTSAPRLDSPARRTLERLSDIGIERLLHHTIMPRELPPGRVQNYRIQIDDPDTRLLSPERYHEHFINQLGVVERQCSSPESVRELLLNQVNRRRHDYRYGLRDRNAREVLPLDFGEVLHDLRAANRANQSMMNAGSRLEPGTQKAKELLRELSSDSREPAPVEGSLTQQVPRADSSLDNLTQADMEQKKRRADSPLENPYQELKKHKQGQSNDPTSLPANETPPLTSNAARDSTRNFQTKRQEAAVATEFLVSDLNDLADVNPLALPHDVQPEREAEHMSEYFVFSTVLIDARCDLANASEEDYLSECYKLESLKEKTERAGAAFKRSATATSAAVRLEDLTVSIDFLEAQVINAPYSKFIERENGLVLSKDLKDRFISALP